MLNKQDTVTSDEREQALRFVAERLEHFSFSEAPRIFSISARKALKAKQSESEDCLKDSGIQSLEEELLRFLTEECAQSFLSNMYGRTSTFLTSRLRIETEPGRKDAYGALIEKQRELREKSLGPQFQSERILETNPGNGAPAIALKIEKRTGCWICGSVLDAILRFLGN